MAHRSNKSINSDNFLDQVSSRYKQRTGCEISDNLYLKAEDLLNKGFSVTSVVTQLVIDKK